MEKSQHKNLTSGMETEHRALFVPADVGACGHYRILQQAEMLMMARKDVNIVPPGHYHGIGQTVTLTQRICSKKTLEAVKKFKEITGSKIIIDFDDLIWTQNGDSLPEYNWCRDHIDANGNREAMESMLSEVADKVTVSTDGLKKSISEFYPADKIFVMPNMLTYREWGFERRNFYPRQRSFYFAGSETHFNNEKKMYGDFSQNLAQFLKSHTVITKHVVPFFINSARSCRSCPLNRYAREFFNESIDAKFILAPLADNTFNKCKSNLKYLESCAVGRVCLCSSFEGGPYESVAHEYQKIPVDATVQYIDYIVNRAEAHYEEILEHQYKVLQSYWLDNSIKRYGDLLEL